MNNHAPLWCIALGCPTAASLRELSLGLTFALIFSGCSLLYEVMENGL